MWTAKRFLVIKKATALEAGEGQALGMPRPVGTPETEKYRERSGEIRIIFCVVYGG